MPFSNAEQISPIMLEIQALNPKTILDIGCGLGLYGFLCRVYLDLYYDQQYHLKLYKKTKRWSTYIVGIEAYEHNLEYIPQWAYDEILVGDVIELLPRIKTRHFDLILALAVVEHFEKDKGFFLLEELKKLGKTVIVSIPKIVREQHVPDNPYETHRSSWSREELASLGYNQFLPHTEVWIAVYGKFIPLDLYKKILNLNFQELVQEIKTISNEFKKFCTFRSCFFSKLYHKFTTSFLRKQKN